MFRGKERTFTEQCLAFRNLLCQQCKEEKLRKIVLQMNSRKINIHAGLRESKSDVQSAKTPFLDMSANRHHNIFGARACNCNSNRIGDVRPHRSLNFRCYHNKTNKQLSQTAAFLRRIPISIKESHTFTLQTRLMSSENEDKVKVKRIYARSPFRWIDIKVKMFLMRSFFDKEFDEAEFLKGARQVRV